MRPRRRRASFETGEYAIAVVWQGDNAHAGSGRLQGVGSRYGDPHRYAARRLAGDQPRGGSCTEERHATCFQQRRRA
jgi:hypothetical protein